MVSEPQEKSLGLAIGLNLLLAGAGYIYMGRVLVGIGALILIMAIYATMPIIFLAAAWIGLNALMAIDMVILNNKKKKEYIQNSTKKCPKCAELIKKEASVCRYCGANFDIATDLTPPPLGSPVVKPNSQPETETVQIIQKSISVPQAQSDPANWEKFLSQEKNQPKNLPMIVAVSVLCLVLVGTALGYKPYMDHRNKIKIDEAYTTARSIKDAFEAYQDQQVRRKAPDSFSNYLELVSFCALSNVVINPNQGLKIMAYQREERFNGYNLILEVQQVPDDLMGGLLVVNIEGVARYKKTDRKELLEWLQRIK